MKQHPKPHRGTHWSVAAGCAGLVALFALSPAQASTVIELEPTIVSALRTAQSSASVTSAVSSLDLQSMEQRGIRNLREALNEVPGVISTSTAGQNGAVSSLLIRGTTTGESLLFLDGVRANGAGNEAGNLLATGRLFNLGRIEVLRGPQSAVYGGESIGGVIWMETPYGSGDPSSHLSVEAGSFNSLSTHAVHQGVVEDLSYFLSLGYEETDNDDAYSNDFHQGSGALRVEAKTSDTWTLGTTHRMADSRYEGGYESGGFVTSIDHFDSSLTTLYARGRHSDVWTSRYTFGFLRESYDNDDSSLGHFYTDLDTFSLSTEQEVRLSEDLLLIAGAYAATDSYESASSFSSVDVSDDRHGVFTALQWDAGEHFTHTAALRWEDYSSHGNEVTWRLGSLWRIPGSDTSLKAGIGTAFRAPSYTDLFYDGSFGFSGNPDLESQTSLGWELGVEQKFGETHRIELTAFRNLIDNAINSFAFPSPVNIPGTTATQGLELGWTGKLARPDLDYHLSWTHLHRSLEDQPRNALTANLRWQASPDTMYGIGATHFSERSYGAEDIAAYTTLRLFASHQLTEDIRIHARIENVLDEEYELYLSQFVGFRDIKQGAGTGVYAGVTIDW